MIFYICIFLAEFDLIVVNVAIRNFVLFVTVFLLLVFHLLQLLIFFLKFSLQPLDFPDLVIVWMVSTGVWLNFLGVDIVYFIFLLGLKCDFWDVAYQSRCLVCQNIDSGLIKMLEKNLFTIFINGLNCLNNSFHPSNRITLQLVNLLLQCLSFLKCTFIFLVFYILSIQWKSDLVITKVLKYNQVLIWHLVLSKPSFFQLIYIIWNMVRGSVWLVIHTLVLQL
jgi:hypothetical protein